LHASNIRFGFPRGVLFAEKRTFEGVFPGAEKIEAVDAGDAVAAKVHGGLGILFTLA